MNTPYKEHNKWIFPNGHTPEKYFYNLIKEHGPIDRSSLNKLTTVPPTTIYDYLDSMRKDGVIEKFPVGNKKRGRSLIFYRIVDGME